MLDRKSAGDPRLEQALALLRSLAAEVEGTGDGLAPWEQVHAPPPSIDRRLSATDSLSWWFRPAGRGASAWDDYFAAMPALEEPLPLAGGPQTQSSHAISRWMALRLLLVEPEEELLDHDADSVIDCLYSFIHAVGRGDVTTAMAYVAPDFHSLEDDRELDRAGLESKIRFMLDSLYGWTFEMTLVEIPQPILHPEGILVYTETLIDALRAEDGARRSIRERRIALFARQDDGRWLLAGFPPMEAFGR